MKRVFSAFLALALLLCPEIFAQADGSSEGESLTIVTTIFPIYDWTLNVLGETADDARLIMLYDNGVDLHSYQPTADDILTITSCDLFIYVGGESDEWIGNIDFDGQNSHTVMLNLLEALGDAAREEELLEGMEAEDEDEDGEEDEIEYDEHIWLSLRNAQTLTRAIAEALSDLDSDNAHTYSENAEAYIEKLQALDEAYTAAVEAAPINILLFGDRFPMRYMADDYGLECYAAFSGCSAETEASFYTIAFLAQTVDEKNLHCVMTIEGAEHKLAQTIVSSTRDKDQRILTMDSMQSVTSASADEGGDYLSRMESNLGVLKDALSGE